MKANELEEYSAKELDRLSREREDAIKAKGGLPYLGSLPVGESKLRLEAKIPTDNPDRDGRPRKADLDQIEGWRKYLLDLSFANPRIYKYLNPVIVEMEEQIDSARKQFVVKKAQDGEDFAWTVNIKSPLYRDLLGFLVKAPIWLRVIRTGEGRA